MKTKTAVSATLKVSEFPKCLQSTLVVEYVTRQAEPTDNLERIAELIYQSNPEVFTYWFETFLRARAPLKQMINTYNHLFSWQNLYVLQNLRTGQLQGVVMALGPIFLSNDYSRLKRISEPYRYAVEHYVEPMVERAMNEHSTTDILLANCCIDPLAREIGLGRLLLENTINILQGNLAQSFTADCRNDDTVAKQLLRSLGFKRISSKTLEDNFYGQRLKINTMKLS